MLVLTQFILISIINVKGHSSGWAMFYWMSQWIYHCNTLTHSVAHCFTSRCLPLLCSSAETIAQTRQCCKGIFYPLCKSETKRKPDKTYKSNRLWKCWIFKGIARLMIKFSFCFLLTWSRDKCWQFPRFKKHPTRSLVSPLQICLCSVFYLRFDERFVFFFHFCTPGGSLPPLLCFLDNF